MRTEPNVSAKWIASVSAAILIAWLPSVAQAQAITEYQIAIYLQGGATPITTATIPAASIVCGQPIVNPTQPVVNPSGFRFADPANPTGLDCRYSDSGSGPLLGLPFNPTAVYEATLKAVNSAGASTESARSNSFTRPGSVPSAPTRLRIGA